MIARTRVRCWGVLLVLGAAVVDAWAQPAPPPAEDFTRAPMTNGVSVSPSAARLAMITTAPSGRRVAAVIGLAEPDKHRVVAAFDDADVLWVRWVNDKRLIYGGARPGALLEHGGAGIFAVDHDGERRRQLTTTDDGGGEHVQMGPLPGQWGLFATLDDGSDDVLMSRAARDSRGDAIAGQLARVNTTTRFQRNLSTGLPPFAAQWVLDAKGTVRVVRTVRDGRERLLWRPPGQDEWLTLDERSGLDSQALVPLALESDDELLVETRLPGSDTAALYVYRLRERKLDPEPVAALKGYDLEPALVLNPATGRVLGLRTSAALPLDIWFDERMTALQKLVDDALPKDRVNRIVCGRCEGVAHLAVVSRSDRQSGELLHFDLAQKSFRRIGQYRPWLTEATQGTRTAHRVAARDGLPLPVFITHPAAAATDRPVPAVVLVHGGPNLRGTDQLWQAEAQFFASRGWRVLEVEFRGSTGFGWKHFNAGWRQWGLAMQDDLADAVAWAAKEKLIDPARVCIFGTSYGGYAALMGPIRHPGVYRCAASFAGVTDIDLLFGATWGNLSHQFRLYGLPTLVGDRERDAQALRDTSPLHRVAGIRVPVLLAQGVYDRRVPPEHADRFVSAARAAGVSIERVNYEEGHGWFESKHHADFLRRLEAFFSRAFAP